MVRLALRCSKMVPLVIRVSFGFVLTQNKQTNPVSKARPSQDQLREPGLTVQCCRVLVGEKCQPLFDYFSRSLLRYSWREVLRHSLCSLAGYYLKWFTQDRDKKFQAASGVSGQREGRLLRPLYFFLRASAPFKLNCPHTSHSHSPVPQICGS